MNSGTKVLGVALALCCGMAVCLPTTAQAQVRATGNAANAGLPYFDIRLDAEGMPVPAVRDVVQDYLKRPTARQAELERITGGIEFARVDTDSLLGTPRYVGSWRTFLTPPAPAALPASVVSGFIAQYPALFDIAPDEVGKARAARNFTTEGSGVTHLTFNQQIGGIDIFKAEVVANVTRQGQLLNISSTMIMRPEGDFAPAAPVLTDAQAIKVAARSVGVFITRDPVPAGEGQGPSQKRSWNKGGDFRDDQPITSERVWFPMTRDDIRPAWFVVIPTRGVGHTYEMVIDATDGTVLFRANELCFDTTQPITFNVYTGRSPAPGVNQVWNDTTQWPFVSRSTVTVTPAQMIAGHSPNGWIDDGNTQTLGNNVDAHLDRDGSPNVPDLPRPDGGVSRIFNFPQDNAADPLTWSNASIVQNFYNANKYHDRIYSLGFNEAAGNFQTNNFGLGGVGNDPVLLDAQDGSGTNNANFATPLDGASGRCQMYIFTGPTPDRDGGMDTDILWHELTHGTSTRLHEGSGNLPAPQSGGMGEGWSDFVALCMGALPTDNANGVNCEGGFTTYLFASGFTTNYFFGIRRFPYTVDLTKNPETYIDINQTFINFDGVPQSPAFGGTLNASEVHNVGEVWCEMLWECRANLINAYGFAGNDMILQLVVDGLGTDPHSPTLIQARDNILAADLVRNGGANQYMLWQAFAKRGLGSGATSPTGATTTSDITESHTVPQFVTFTYPNGQPSALISNAPTSFSVHMTGNQLTITPGTARLNISANGGAYSQVTLTESPAGSGTYVGQFPAEPCPTIVSYYVSVDTSVGAQQDPPTAPASVLGSIATPFSRAAVFSDSFETNLGWVASAVHNAGTTSGWTGNWQRVVPVGTAAAPGANHTTGGTMCYVTQNSTALNENVGINDVDNQTVLLTSPTINMAGYPGAVFSAWVWFHNTAGNNAGTNVFTMDVSSDNGATWTTVKTLSGSWNGGWTYEEANIAAFPSLTTNATMKVRFVTADLTGAVVEGGVDDVVVYGIVCPSPCVADVDDGSGTGSPDGGVTIDDLLYYLGIFAAGAPAADVDDGSGTGTHDGGVTIDDLLYFLTRFAAGC